jgi:hypothetical protein
MVPVVTTAAFVALATAALLVSGCRSSEPADAAVHAAAGQAVTHPPREPALARPKNTKRLDADQLVEKLAAAGLVAEELGPAQVSTNHLSRFPEEPRSTLWLRISDGQGNSEPMTFVEFGSWKAAADVDAKPVNGFAARNWFVLGIVSNHFVTAVTQALDG